MDTTFYICNKGPNETKLCSDKVTKHHITLTFEAACNTVSHLKENYLKIIRTPSMAGLIYLCADK